jgi:hypothetical protein
VPGGIGSSALTGLLALMVSYLRKADGGAQAYAKGIAPLMARTNFTTMFRSLRKGEQRFFGANNAREWIHLVLSVAHTQTGMNGNTPLFRSGLVYLADVQGMSQAQVDVYRRRLDALTKTLWLTEMTRGTDVLSKEGWLQGGGAAGLAGEFESLGALGGRKERVGANAEVPAPIFELRRMNQNVDYTQWAGIAVGIFDYLLAVNQKQQAAYSRNRFW